MLKGPKKYLIFIISTVVADEKKHQVFLKGLIFFLLSTPHPMLSDEVLMSAENQGLHAK